MRTYITKPDHIEHQWWVVDAEGQTLGRLASEVAKILRGKHKPYYTPNLDCGDFVIVLNANKIHVTGNKMDDKIYYRHSGYPGGIRGMTLRDQLAKHPTRTVRKAVRGMLPHNRLGRRMIKKLKIYADDSHPHEAQQPKALEI
ncbi:MAG: 50S ribosomal protein L13 [Anaerolineae bacterium]